MANENANIDLLFRNGLKDYEVLPPVEVWNNIFPVIRKKQKPYILLRSAAIIAVLLSLSFLVYRWSKQFTNDFQNLVVARSEESYRDRINSTSAVPLSETSPNVNQIRIAAVSPVQSSDVPLDVPGNSGLSHDQVPFQVPDAYSTVNNMSLNGNVSGIQKLKNLLNSNASEGFSGPDDYLYTEPKEKTSRWSLTAMASPTYYQSQVSGNDELSEQINSSEKSRLSYTGGVGFAYKVSKKLSIQSGLYYASMGQSIDGISSYMGFRRYDYTKGDHNFEVMTSSGVIYTSNTDIFLQDNTGDRVVTKYTNDVFDPDKANLSYASSSLYQNFSYLEMPVMLRYKVLDKTVDLNLIGGLSYNMLLNNSVNAVVNGSKHFVGKTAGLNPFMVSSSLGMGMEYSLSEKFSLNLEPTFRYYLNSFNNVPGTKAHPYSFGVFSGLSYKF